jgi:gliding motility-associated-like protein
VPNHIYLTPSLFTVLICLFLTPLAFSQPCLYEKQFAKTYASNGVTNQHFLLTLNDYSLVVGGPVNNKLLLLKTDFTGTTVWSKKFTATSTQFPGSFTQAVVDKDGSLACAFDNSYLAKVDTAGNVLTTTKLAKSSGIVSFMDLAVLENGDKIVLLNDGNSYTDNYLLARISADLTRIIWTENFTAADANYKNLVVDGDRILLAGFVAYNINVLSFSATDGHLIKQSCFRVANRKNSTNKLYKYNGGYLLHGYLFQEASDASEDNNIIVRLALDMTPVKVTRLVNIDRHLNVTLSVEPDGSYYGAYGWKTNNLMYVDRNDAVIWARSNGAVPTSTPIHLTKNSGGLIAAGGDVQFDSVTRTYSWYYSLIKSDLDGTFINCPYKDTSVSTEQLTFEKKIPTVSAKSTSTLQLSKANSSTENLPLLETALCIAPDSCSTLEISGNTTICEPGMVTYTGKREPGCTLPMKWSILGDSVIQKAVNDSTIEVGFLKSGTYLICANLIKGCHIINDTIQVKVLASSLQTFALGPDIGLCPDNTLQLNAPKGFESYRWYDGSTAPTLNVTQPGVYNISAMDSCGNTFNDTILVKLKLCIRDFYIPNSFTPNNDGRNDVFRPFLGGNVVSYRFTIYNRWGENVFETTELGKGWDGNTRGRRDKTSAYVWTCVYQLSDGVSKREKGTVVLIR